MNRREMLAAAAAFGLHGCAGGSSALPVLSRALRGASVPPPNAKPYVFLDKMMDLHATGSQLRLAQSFVPTPQLNLGDLAFTYDNAVMICAYLARGTSDDVARATILGDTLLAIQAHDPIGDGRLRWDYHTHPLFSASGAPRFPAGDGGADTGNMSWAGMALMQLYAATKEQKYLAGATAIADWIVKYCSDTRGAGGFTGGLTKSNVRITWKSTEHNLDAYALFVMLGDSTHAASALALVDAMWDAKGGYYWVGTGYDGVTLNKSFIPEDVQTWSFLSTGRAQYASSIDWASKNLSASQGGFDGVSFSNSDRSGVWFEGTAHLATALAVRSSSGSAAAQPYLATLAKAETQAPNADGYGIDAASKNGLRTGDGDKYFAALHTGATAWYCLAELKSNPFALK